MLHFFRKSPFRTARKVDFRRLPLNTGHALLDAVLADGLAREGPQIPSYRASGTSHDVLFELCPALAGIARESDESLARALLIDVYALEERFPGVRGGYPENAKLVLFDRLAFRRLVAETDRARVSADDACALLAEIPQRLMEDGIDTLHRLLMRSFPKGAEPALARALRDWLDTVDPSLSLRQPRAALLFARLDDLARLAGADPETLPHGRARAEAAALAADYLAMVRTSIGPTHRKLLDYEDRIRAERRKENPDMAGLAQEREALKAQTEAELDAATPEERARVLADFCQMAVPDERWAALERWGGFDLPCQPYGYGDRSLFGIDLDPQFRRKLAPTEPQALTILNYVLSRGHSRKLSVPLARSLARALTPGHPELFERLEKARGRNAKALAILKDALAGSAAPVDSAAARKAERMAQVAAEGTALRQRMAERGLGQDRLTAAQRLAPYREPLDLPNYAMLIAIAQSEGCDVAREIAGLEEISVQARARFDAFAQDDMVYDDFARETVARLSPKVVRAWKNGGAGDALRVARGRDLEIIGALMLQANRRPKSKAEIVAQDREDLDQLDRLLGRMHLLQAHPDLLAFEREMAAPEAATRPSATWLKTCRKRGLPAGLIERLAGFEVAWVQSGYARHTRLAFAETEKAALRADLWALHMAPPDTAAPLLRDVVAQCFATRPGIGIKAEKVGNAALWALEAMPDGAGVPSLARILARTRYAKVREKINAALDRAAEAAGTSRQTLDEITVPDHEMASGTRRLPVGPGAARFTFANGRIEIAWEDQDGKTRKATPKALKAADPEGVKAVRALAKEIVRDLATQSIRLQGLYLDEVSWPAETWRERYADHGTLALLARRLVWDVQWPDGRRTRVMPNAAGARDVHGAPVDLAGATIRLFHPLMASEAERDAWRDRLIALEITQPFKQVWRETYRLTDAERATASYSNRFAAHILRQHQMMSLAAGLGWKSTHRMWVDAANDEPTHLRLPAHGLQAEFWTAGAGGEDPPVLDSGAYRFLTSDRVQFHRLDAAARFGRGDVVPLDAVPEMVFSEIMRHADLFTSVASICMDADWIDRGGDARHPNQWERDTADAYWQRGLTADLSASGETRRAVLARLLPLLAGSGGFTLEKTHLRVRGTKHEYLIHLGSGAVILADSQRHVCIVPAPTKEKVVYLPFEGDMTLATILSKAMLLAQDEKIKDPVILRQI